MGLTYYQTSFPSVVPHNFTYVTPNLFSVNQVRPIVWPHNTVHLGPITKFFNDHFTIKGSEIYYPEHIHHKLKTTKSWLWGAFTKTTYTALGELVRKIDQAIKSNKSPLHYVTQNELEEANAEINADSDWSNCASTTVAGALLSMVTQDATPLMAAMAFGNCLPTASAQNHYAFEIGKPYSIPLNFPNLFGNNFTLKAIYQYTNGATSKQFVFAPQPVSSLPLTGSIYGVQSNGTDLLYAALGGSGFSAINTQDKTNPKVLNTIASPQSDNMVYPYKQYLGVARGGAGAYLYDCTHPNNCVQLGFYNTPGTCSAVLLTEETTYGITFRIADGPNYRISSFLTPGAPVLVSTVGGLVDTCSLTKAGSFTLLAANLAGVHLVKDSNPAAPTLIATYPTTPTSAQFILARSDTNIAYVALQDQSLLLLRFDLTGLFTVANYKGIGWVSAVALNGNHLLVADATTGAGFTHLDVEYPELIRKVSDCALAGQSFSIASLSSYAVVGDGSSTYLSQTVNLFINAPTITASGTVSSTQRGIHYFQADGFDGNQTQSTRFSVLFYDQTTVKTKPNDVSVAISEYGTTSSFLYDPSLLFYYSGPFGLLNFNSTASKWSDFTVKPNIAMSTYKTIGTITDLTVQNSVVIATMGLQGVFYGDATIPTAITSYLVVTGAGSANKVVTRATDAIIANGAEGLRVDSFKTASTPYTVGNWKYLFGGTAYDVTVIGSTAFLAYDWVGIPAVNIDTLQLRSIYNTTAAALSIDSDEEAVYASLADQSLVILNVKNITSPTPFAQIGIPGKAGALLVNGHRVFLTTGLTKLIVVDSSNRFAPFVKSITTTQGIGRALAIDQNLLYVSEDGIGEEVFLIADPPQSKLTIPTSTNATAVTFIDAIPLIADGQNILYAQMAKITYSLSVISSANNSGTYQIVTSCTNNLGKQAASISSLRIEGSPIITSPIADIVAFVGNAFSWIVPPVFVDPNGDVLSYSVQGISWGVASTTGVVQGTPQLSDVGTNLITITADDGHGGKSVTQAKLTVKVPPYVDKSIPTQFVDLNTFTTLPLDKTSIISPSGTPLEWTLTLSNGQPLPPGISFNSATFELTVTTSIPASYQLTLLGKDKDGGRAQSNFYLIATSKPKITRPITAPILKRGTKYSYTLPSGTIASPNTPLSFKLSVKDAKGTLLPDNSASFNDATQTMTLNIKDELGPLSAQLTILDSLGAATTVSYPVDLDYFPEISPRYTLPDLTLDFAKDWQLRIPTDFFTDSDGEQLTLSVIAPAGLTLLNNIITWRPFELGTFPITITATDPKGGSTSYTFKITVTPFPVTNAPPPLAIAPINQAFNYPLPASTFYSESGALTSTFSGLPTFLKEDLVNKKLIGTPTLTDEGFYNITWTVKDAKGGSANTSIPIYATFIVEQKELLQDITTRVNVAFTSRISNNTFINKSGRKTTIELNPKGLVNFDQNASTISGMLNKVGTFPISLIANDTISNAEGKFNLIVVPNKKPEFFFKPPEVYVETGDSIELVMPGNMFIDADGDPLAYSVRMADGSSVPDWCVVDLRSLTISGDVPKVATTWASSTWISPPITGPQEYVFIFGCSDGFDSVEGSFRLKVGGDSALSTSLQFITILTGLFVIYQLKNVARNFFGQFKLCGIDYKTDPFYPPFYEQTERILHPMVNRCTVVYISDKKPQKAVGLLAKCSSCWSAIFNRPEELPLEKMFEKNFFFDPVLPRIEANPTPSFNRKGHYVVRSYGNKWNIGTIICLWPSYLFEQFEMSIGASNKLDVTTDDQTP